MAEVGRRSPAVVGRDELRGFVGLWSRKRKLLDQPQRRRSEVNDGRSTESGREVTNRAVLSGIAPRFALRRSRWARGSREAASASGTIRLADRTTLSGQPHDAALMPGHDDVEPQCLENQQRDPQGPRAHERQRIRRRSGPQLRGPRSTSNSTRANATPAFMQWSLSAPPGDAQCLQLFWQVFVRRTYCGILVPVLLVWLQGQAQASGCRWESPTSTSACRRRTSALPLTRPRCPNRRHWACCWPPLRFCWAAGGDEGLAGASAAEWRRRFDRFFPRRLLSQSPSIGAAKAARIADAPTPVAIRSRSTWRGVM